ncbi:MAG: aspartate--tRNA(Asn) ligase [Parcubacteria group bacterium]
MQRILIDETPKLIGQVVKLQGWVSIRRDHGKLIFIDLRDRSGKIQMVIIPDKEDAYKAAKEIRSECIIEVEGLVKARPGGAKNEKIPTGGVEIEVEKLDVISKPEVELPVDISVEGLNLNLDTLLDNRTLTLRNEKIKAIFKIYAEMIGAYARIAKQEGFLEIKTPKILDSATEGGANFFKIKYFDKDAYLAQSPQFYKQAGVGIFERVFEVGSVFRAEPHYTTRHVNEYIGLDAEMGFIENFEDVMVELEKVMTYVMREVSQNCQSELESYGAQILPVEKIPRMKLTEALDILDKEYGKKMDEVDIDAEGERLICEWVKKNHNSDFVFLTHYPAAIRPFYSMPSPDPQYTDTFDLLFMGVEIASGGQRIHDYGQLVANMKKHKLNPEEFSHYLDIFKYGIPPHGGWGLGSERIVQKILGLGSIKEAILFPRDVKRLTP